MKTYEEALREQLKGATSQLIFFEETDSTNTRAMAMGRQGEPHGTVVVAERQTAGKGRNGRQWESPVGTGIWMSLLLRPKLRPENAPMLNLVMGLSVARACQGLAIDGLGIKWPNDVLLGTKKVCGILTETETQGGSMAYLVIGSGLNVNTAQFPHPLSERATSLYLETGREYDRAEVFGRILDNFWHYYGIFLQTQSMAELKEEYNRLLVNAGREVRLVEEGRERQGRALGIDDHGALLVEGADGGILAVSSGEVSVRGIYGYV